MKEYSLKNAIMGLVLAHLELNCDMYEAGVPGIDIIDTNNSPVEFNFDEDEWKITIGEGDMAVEYTKDGHCFDTRPEIKDAEKHMDESIGPEYAHTLGSLANRCKEIDHYYTLIKDNLKRVECELTSAFIVLQWFTILRWLEEVDVVQNVIYDIDILVNEDVVEINNDALSLYLKPSGEHMVSVNGLNPIAYFEIATRYDDVPVPMYYIKQAYRLIEERAVSYWK